MTDDAKPGQPSFPTSIGTSTPTTMSLLGHDIATEILGKVSFGELAMWLMTGVRPSAGQARVFDTVMAGLADHGLTPIAIASRLTLYSAPESIQGALAAGLLGGGSRFLGVTEDTGRFLAAALDSAEHAPESDADFDELAKAAVSGARAQGKLVPGLGHPVHKNGDPRTPVIIAIAEEEGLRGPQLRLFEAIGRGHADILRWSPRCRSTAPESAARRWQTSACRSPCCAARCCWRGVPDCSATWVRKCAVRSARRYT